MGTHEHRRHDVRAVACAVVTVSDSRDAATDRSGALIRDVLAAAGHVVRSSVIVPDERPAIRAAVQDATRRGDTHAVIVTGGTGVAARDVTIESVADLWTKELPGFGEIFRSLSFAEIGPAAFLSRATAGVIAETFVVLLPGSVGACRLAVERLVLPELAHVVSLLRPAP